MATLDLNNPINKPVSGTSGVKSQPNVFAEPTANWADVKPADTKTGPLLTTFNSNEIGAVGSKDPVFNQPIQPAKEQTVMSSDKTQQIADMGVKADKLSQGGATLGADGVVRAADNTVLSQPQDQTQPKAPAQPETYAINAEQDPMYQANLGLIDSMKAQLDASSMAQINAISNQYGNLQAQQRDANMRSEKSRAQSLLMGGSSRYAQLSSEGIQHQQVSYGLQEIANLQSKEIAAITAVKKAQNDGNFQLMAKKLELAEGVRKEKQARMEKLQEKLDAKNEKLQEEKIKASRESAIVDLISQGINDPKQLLNMLNSYEDGSDTGGGFTLKEINDVKGILSPDVKDISNTLTTAVKYGLTDPKIMAKIGGAKTNLEALQIAAPYLQDPKAKYELEEARLNTILKGEQIASSRADRAEKAGKGSKEEIAAQKQALAQIPELQDKIKLIDTLKNSKGISAAVGTYGISRFTPLSADKAAQRKLISGVSQLIEQSTLDKLLALKQAGGTLGALSEGEKDMLKKSASQIGSWEMKDENGRVTGYEIDEESFKEELENIKQLTERAVTNAMGNVVSSGEQDVINQFVGSGNVPEPTNVGGFFE